MQLTHPVLGNKRQNKRLRATKPLLRKAKKKRRLVAVGLAALLLALGLGSTLWLGATASTIKAELDAVTAMIPTLKEELVTNKLSQADATVQQVRLHTSAAKQSVESPIWALASSLPGVGQNFSAVSEVARSADDVANLGLAPLVKVFSTIDWNSLVPSKSGAGLEPIRTASPTVSSSAHAVRLSAERLNNIDSSKLLPQVADPLKMAQDQLVAVTDALNTAADAARLAPDMMGAEAPRKYLLMIQNNAEIRASGGIPGALAVLTLDNGKLTLGAQSSAGDIGVMSPVVPVDTAQQQIYSARLGKFMQDVNLSPDFPTAASTAQAMWERKTGQRVDGVLSIDPVALSYLLDATGPIQLSSPELAALAASGLPSELTGQNVVQTLLSDVYAKVQPPAIQDVYFAGVAQEIFAALSNGQGDATALISGITKGAEEGRILIWSSLDSEQRALSKYAVSGSVSGSSVSPAQFGVYFNDGTGAKMDYYVKRTVQLVKECPRDGYEATTVRITSTNTAPADAALALPTYVTGNGHFGVPAGSVQTNIVVYGPVQANVETAKVDGVRESFAPYLHDNRPVGIMAVQLAPGESKTVDFTFGKIVQHTEPDLFVTPTVQPVKEVELETKNASCG